MKKARVLQRCVVGAASAQEAMKNTNNGVKLLLGAFSINKVQHTQLFLCLQAPIAYVLLGCFVDDFYQLRATLRYAN